MAFFCGSPSDSTGTKCLQARTGSSGYGASYPNGCGPATVHIAAAGGHLFHEPPMTSKSWVQTLGTCDFYGAMARSALWVSHSGAAECTTRSIPD